MSPLWTLNSPPNWAPDAVATTKGWENADTGEVYVAISGLVTKGGSANIIAVEFSKEEYEEGDVLAVTVRFNERVSVTAGATLVVTFSGTGGNKTLYAAAQTNVNEVVFNKISDNTTNQTLAASTAATGTLTLAANPTANDTVTIGAKVYTFKADVVSADNVNGYVKIGGSASASLDNLIAAINLAAGAGSTYAAATTVHPTVTAAAGTGDTMDVTAKTAGTGGNSIATTDTLTNGGSSFGAATLTGGVSRTGNLTIGSQTVGGTIIDVNSAIAATQTLTCTAQPSADETVVIDGKTYTFKAAYSNTNGHVTLGDDLESTLANLVVAINLGDGAGSRYAAAMTLHSTVSAKQLSATAIKVTAKTAGTGGNSLATTETLAAGSWGSTTLAGGVASVASTKTVSAGVGTAAGTATVVLAS